MYQGKQMSMPTVATGPATSKDLWWFIPRPGELNHKGTDRSRFTYRPLKNITI